MRRLTMLATVFVLATGCTNAAPHSAPTQSAITIPQIPSPQARLDISHWKVYSDRFISFKYPGEFGIGVDKHANLPVTISLGRKDDYIVPIGITYEKDTSGASIKDFYIKGGNIQYSLTKIDGWDAYVFTSGDKMQTWDIIFAKGMAFNLGAEQSHDNQDYKNILNVFETLLSTVRFK